MKTSNKLLIFTSLIIISALIFYNYGLRGEYRKGEYKSRFYKMTKENIDGFTSIENKASNLYVRIERGDKFEIWFSNEIKDKVNFSKKNGKLVIDFNKLYDEEDYFRSANLIIICPTLENFKAGNLIVKPYNKKYYIPQGTTTIYGFNQQELNLETNSFTDVSLESNKISSLFATVGDTKSTIAIINIDSNNKIDKLIAEVKGKSKLNLNNPLINIAEFQLSDSADVNLSGRALKLLKN